MTTKQLSLKDLSLSFGAQRVLRAQNLDVHRGESVVLIGPSGQGKTVTLKLFAGLIKPDRGRVEFEGEDLKTLSDRQQTELRLKMGMLFQKNALFDSLSVKDNIAFPLSQTTRLRKAEIQSKVAYFLEAVGLQDAGQLYPNDISGGMQKRLGIARALALDPEIVLYDDPTAGLDPITSRRIVELILTLKRKRQSTVIAVTNDMARAYQLADRIVMVTDGELIKAGNKQETLSHPDARVANFIRGRVSA